MVDNQEKKEEFSGFEPVQEESGKVVKPARVGKRLGGLTKRPIGQRRGMERPAVKPDSRARRLANFVLLETIFLLVMLGACGYLFYFSYTLKRDLAECEKELNEANENVKTLNSDLEQTRTDKEEALNQRDKVKSEYDIISSNRNQLEQERNTLMSKKEVLENELNLSRGENEEKDTKLSEVSERKVHLEDLVKELKSEKKTIRDKLNGIEKDYDRLLKEEEQAKLVKASSQKDIEQEYLIYAPSAVRMIEKLREVHAGIKTGLDFKQFTQLINDDLDIAFEEFTIKIKEKHQAFLSFRFISEAYSAYKETVERWRSLARSPLPEDIGSFRENIIKFEQPIEQYHPWVDTIQILWQRASLFTNVADGFIDAQESLDLSACLGCNGQHIVVCPKCASNETGECVHCGGKGYLDQTSKPICQACMGSKKCPTCLGKRSIFCPVCTFAIGTRPEK